MVPNHLRRRASENWLDRGPTAHFRYIFQIVGYCLSQDKLVVLARKRFEGIARDVLCRFHLFKYIGACLPTYQESGIES
jgi:hypothetical protein